MENKTLNIFMIDDDEKLSRLLVSFLKGFNIELATATHPKEGLKRFLQGNYRLLILDLMLPGMDGFQVCREVRKESNIPIIMLTARGEVADRIVGLEMGADDYLSKPFEPRELVARIQTILRRTLTHDKQEIMVWESGNLRMDLFSREVFLNGELLQITTTEFELLKLFMDHSGKAMNRDYIMDELKGIDWEVFNRSIDIAISRLRQKLGDTPKNPKFLKTIWGEGYMFIAPVQKSERKG
ncbi:MAG: response regulator [Nitrospiria bacterium]